MPRNSISSAPIRSSHGSILPNLSTSEVVTPSENAFGSRLSTTRGFTNNHSLKSESDVNDVITKIQRVRNRISDKNRMTSFFELWNNPIFSGIDLNDFPEISAYEYHSETTETIQFNEIDLTSRCESEAVIIDGLADVSIIPRSRILSRSDITRVIHFLSERPQNQIRLTQQIMLCLQVLLGTEDVSVSIDAILFSVKSANTTEVESGPITVAVGGILNTGKKDANY